MQSRAKGTSISRYKASSSNQLTPVEVAKAFKDLGFTELYVADLDAIIDCSTNFRSPQKHRDETGLKLMVDAGVTSIERAQKLLDSGVSKLIIGTETLQNKKFVEQAVETFWKRPCCCQFGFERR